MTIHASRRRFLQTAAAGSAFAGLGDLGFLSGLPAVRAAEAKVDTGIVQMRPEIEPLVKLLEDTPRNKLLEEVAARIHRGTTYREVLAALLLAGVRNVQPRPRTSRSAATGPWPRSRKVQSPRPTRPDGPSSTQWSRGMNPRRTRRRRV